VAYVSLDINPSIELALNKFNKVVSYEAYNLDGETLLVSNDETHIPLDKAINNIIADAVNQNYISSSKDSAIALSAISDDTILRKGLEIHLKNEIENNLENRSIHISVVSSNNNLAKRDEAKSIGFTVGKLLLVEELKSLDSSILIEDFKDISIVRIKNKILEFKNNSCNNYFATNVSDTNNNTLHSTDKNTRRIDKNTRRIDSASNTSNITPNNSNNGNASISLPSNSNSANTFIATPSNSNNENTFIAPPSDSNNENTFIAPPSNSNNRNTSNDGPGNSNNRNTSNDGPGNSNNRNTSNDGPGNSNNRNASNDGPGNSNNRNTSNDGPGNSNNGNASNDERGNKDKDKDKTKNHRSNLYKDGDIILKSYAGEI
jgi:hypothetical protein